MTFSNKVPMIATVFLDMNIGLLRRIKLKSMFQDYSPLDLSRITLSKLLKCNFFNFGVEDLLTECS